MNVAQLLIVTIYCHLYPDPHFLTLKGDSFSFHGECDLVLLKSPGFLSGRGLDIHVRTTRVDSSTMSYSYISDAALSIGNDVLEVSGGDGSIIINGAEVKYEQGSSLVSSTTSSFAEFTIRKTFKGTYNNIHVYTLDLHNHGSIQIRSNSKTGMLFVDVTGYFPDGEGLLGASSTAAADDDHQHSSRKLLARDGKTDLFGEWNAHGEEWQVRPSLDSKLFQKNRAPQYPAGCSYEVSQQHKAHLRRRRLMDSGMDKVVEGNIARNVCAHASAKHKQFCIDDVMATGDLEIAEDPFYHSGQQQ